MATWKHTVWVTSTGRPTDHAVSDDDMAEAMSSGRRFTRVCGDHFWPAAVCAPPGSACPRCLLILKACASPTPDHQRARPRRRGSLLRWLFAGLFRPPAGSLASSPEWPSGEPAGTGHGEAGLRSPRIPASSCLHGLRVGSRAGSPVSMTSSRDVTRQYSKQLRVAAVRYTLHGWGVLPGSVWDGRQYTLGHTPTPVEGLLPVMLSGRTFRHPRQAWSWWSVAPYSVLARAGADFDVLVVPAPLIERATTRTGLGPVLCTRPSATWYYCAANQINWRGGSIRATPPSCRSGHRTFASSVRIRPCVIAMTPRTEQPR
ncbi:hypothetical protein FB471_6483 [Amycolatopsis cihanbeyliensis]|uniref:Uncharacterized protein n=1 Tax=Amycolatopsis cihanbeyliensis TaxID=1128664 RepID=A0A542CU55_AMYCI|nr:hypothetical protein FB471_6483 [Amycolatopsis cihanbeyliensis]